MSAVQTTKSSTTKLSKAQLTTIFKQTINQFMDFLGDQYSSQSDMMMLILAYRVMIQSDTTDMDQLFEMFTIRILPYENLINNNDENYFLNEDINTSGDSIKHIFRLRELWKYSNAEIKQIIWKYVKVLLALSNQYKTYINIINANDIPNILTALNYNENKTPSYAASIRNIKDKLIVSKNRTSNGLTKDDIEIVLNCFKVIIHNIDKMDSLQVTHDKIKEYSSLLL